MKQLDDLVEISRFYGSKKEYVLAGGGNTSFKNKDTIWVKASGIALSTIDKNGFVPLSRNILDEISEKKYSNDPDERERQVKADLYRAKVYPDDRLRPSVETSLHNLIGYAFVIHLHPTLVNGLMCARQSREKTMEFFGEKVLYIEYTDPGYVLFKKVEKEIRFFNEKHKADPQIILLENHGIFVSADNISEVKTLYSNIFNKINENLIRKTEIENLPSHPELKNILPVIRMLVSEDTPKILKYRNNSIIQEFAESAENFQQAALPFSPDIIVYCKSKYMYIDHDGSVEDIINQCKKEIECFSKNNPFTPRIILIKDVGLIAIEDNSTSAEIALDVYEDLLHISHLTRSFGGPRFMTGEQIAFIDNWEVENYRRKVAKGDDQTGKVENKIAIVTGGAQGFGAGIAEDLFNEGANVVIADLNEKKGKELSEILNGKQKKNQALFVQTDVSNPLSAQNLIAKTVETFGGIDLLISNAGILFAGSLDEMQPDVFNKMTQVNYNAYYLCVKYASEILKLQHAVKPDYCTDIIQINSKSGLTGSKKNFAYAGAKFGGIGLTQSFALELVEFNIKVNSICPGNYFDGPLWSDPENGLFVQYLKSGKVPGAKTIEDVKKHYENQVPMNRGCRIEDVMKAIYYVIDQTYETGQAIPVTGGQVMLS